MPAPGAPLSVNWVAPTATFPVIVPGVGPKALQVVERSPKRLSKKYPWVSRKFGPPKENVADSTPRVS